MRKGFPSGEQVAWEPEVLEALEQTIGKVAPDSVFQWSDKQIVTVVLADSQQPWVSIQTKKNDGLWLQIPASANAVSDGQTAGLAAFSEVQPDVVRLGFADVAEVTSDDLRAFLLDHLDDVVAQ